MDPWVLECVMGYRIAFIKAPVQKCIPVSRASSEMQALISTEVETLLGKGSHKRGGAPGDRGRFLFQDFHYPQERQASLASGQSSTLKPFHRISTFQAGEHPSSERLASVGGLDGASGSKGCLLCGSNLEWPLQIPTFQVGWQNL